MGRRARTPGAEIWAQPAPPPQHHRGWLTAPSSFQGVRRRKQQRTPAFFPFFPSCAPRVQTQRGFPFAPWQRQGWRQPRAPGHVYSRQEPPLRSPSEQHGPDCFLEAFQAAALAGCSACWHGHEARGREGREAVAGVLVLPAQRPGAVLQSPREAKGAPGGARVVLSTQPHSLLASSPRQIGSHKQGRQFLGMVPLSCVMLGGQQVTALPQQAGRSSSAGEISAPKRFPLQNKPELVYQDFHQSQASCVVVGAGGAG